jgi:hypothetical protein
MEYGELRGPLHEAEALVRDIAMRGPSDQAALLGELEAVGMMLLSYALQVLDDAAQGKLDEAGACAFEHVTNGVGNVVEAVRSIACL